MKKPKLSRTPNKLTGNWINDFKDFEIQFIGAYPLKISITNILIGVYNKTKNNKYLAQVFIFNLIFRSWIQLILINESPKIIFL